MPSIFFWKQEKRCASVSWLRELVQLPDICTAWGNGDPACAIEEAEISVDFNRSGAEINK